jgi:hypothetical protein
VEALEPRRTPAVNFAAQQTFATGANPDAVVVADFNGDGKPDLAVVNRASNTVSVLLNTTPKGASTPSFAAQQTFAVGTEPDFLEVADFNGDGRPDLVAADVNDGNVTVLVNTTPAGASTPSFAAAQTFAVGGNNALPYYYLAVADFNGDGKPDLAENTTRDTLAVSLNTTPTGSSTVSFTAPQNFSSPGNGSLAAGDFNGDGKPDLVVGYVGFFKFPGTTVSVLLNTTPTGSATASFAAPQTFDVGATPGSMSVGDLNGDGKLDLAVLTGSGVTILVNTTPTGSATASFAAPQAFAGGGSVVADFNGDGKPDLAVSDSATASVSVSLNATPAGATTLSFAAPQTFAVGLVPVAVAAGDFNGDGKLDLAVVNLGDTESLAAKTVSVLLNASVSAVVGQFGGQGVWRYDNATGAWTQLTGANASALATDVRGDVAGEFPGAGVWQFRPSGGGWQQINGIDATALAMDASGDIVANFPGFGVGEFLPGSGWTLLTGAGAGLLAVDATGDVAAAFPGAGVWRFRPTGGGWQQINGQDATLLAVDDLGDVVANFRSVGVGQYQPATGGWQVLNGVQATALAVDWQGRVAAEFPGFGVGQFVPGSGWTSLTAANANLLTAADGAVVGAFGGLGVWEFDPTRGWFQITAAQASALAMA